MYCKRCGAPLQQGVLICPECGARQRRRASSFRCAYCHGRVAVGMAMCPHCGRNARPAGPRWGLWLAGLLILALAGLWGLGKLPVEGMKQEIADTRARLTGLAQIAEFVTPVSPRGATLTPALVAAVSPAPATPSSTAGPTRTPEVTRPSPTATRTASPSATADTNQYYTVQNGDTLEIIGSRTGIPWQTIAAANGINEFTILQVGQRLRLPAPTPAATATPTRTPGASPTSTGTPTAAPSATPTSTQVASPTAAPITPTSTPASTRSSSFTYRVQAGDTLETIGQKFGVSWEAIAAANNITGATVLQIGQELIIPSADSTPAPTATPRPQPTPTPVPTTPAPSYPAPALTSPSDNTPFSGEDAFIELVWQPVPGMAADLQYQVTIRWMENGAQQKPYDMFTTASSIRAPLWLWGKADKPARKYTWSVTVVRLTTDGKGGQRVIPLSPTSATRTFSWS